MPLTKLPRPCTNWRRRWCAQSGQRLARIGPARPSARTAGGTCPARRSARGAVKYRRGGSALQPGRLGIALQCRHHAGLRRGKAQRCVVHHSQQVVRIPAGRGARRLVAAQQHKARPERQSGGRSGRDRLKWPVNRCCCSCRTSKRPEFRGGPRTPPSSAVQTPPGWSGAWAWRRAKGRPKRGAVQPATMSR